MGSPVLLMVPGWGCSVNKPLTAPGWCQQQPAEETGGSLDGPGGPGWGSAEAAQSSTSRRLRPASVPLQSSSGCLSRLGVGAQCTSHWSQAPLRRKAFPLWPFKIKLNWWPTTSRSQWYLQIFFFYYLFIFIFLGGGQFFKGVHCSKIPHPHIFGVPLLLIRTSSIHHPTIHSSIIQPSIQPPSIHPSHAWCQLKAVMLSHYEHQHKQ